MRIRFRALDFGLVAQINIIRVKDRNRLLVRRWCSGHSFFCSCDSAVKFLDPENSSQTSTTATSGAAPGAIRSALDSSIQAYAQILVWPRRDVPRRFTWCFFSTKHPIPARELLLCVYSRMIRKPRKTRTGCARCSPCYLGPIPPRPTASCSLAAVRRGDFVRASWLYS